VDYSTILADALRLLLRLPMVDHDPPTTRHVPDFSELKISLYLNRS